MTAVSDETGRGWLPLKYEDGPDFCTVTFATGAAFALTVHPERMKLMEAALSASPVGEKFATKPPIEDGGRAVIEGGSVVIRFPLDAMQDALDGAWGLHVFDTRQKITDIAEFAKEFRNELNSESENGTTLIHRMADKAFLEMMEQGAFGFEPHEEQEL